MGKVDIENVLFQNGSGFSAKKTVHIHRLFDKILIDGAFFQSGAFLVADIRKNENTGNGKKDKKQQDRKIEILPIM